MMKQVFLILSFLVLGCDAWSQKSNTLLVNTSAEEWFVAHTVETGESIFSLARKYHVPAAVLTRANNVGYQDALPPGSTINIPLGIYNLVTQKPETGSTETRPLFIKATGNENLYKIAKKLKVNQSDIQTWNNMPDTEIRPGTSLLIGWVQYDNTPLTKTTNVSSNSNAVTGSTTQKTATNPTPTGTTTTRSSYPVTANPAPQQGVSTTVISRPAPTPDTAKAPEKEATGLELAYDMQTNRGLIAQTEKGTAVFFKAPGNIEDGTCYAFHNYVAKGNVIKVTNPANGKSVFIKVLGPLPNTKQYHNAIIGIGSCALKELESMDARMWCEISY